MEENYYRAYKEVIEILRYVPQESVNKIPKTMIETFKKKMNKNHLFQVDTSKPFEEQKILEETKDIFAIIFRDYWATKYQREKIKEKEKWEIQKIEEEKANKYKTNDIFKNKKHKIMTIENEIPNVQIIEYRENIFIKFLKEFIKKLRK